MRLALVAVLGSALASFANPCYAANTHPHVAVVIPGLVLDERDKTLASVLGLPPWAIYVFRSDDRRGRRIGRGPFERVDANAGGDRVAAISGLPANEIASLGGYLTILDSYGNQLKTFDKIVQAGWATDGKRLALIKGTFMPEAELPDVDSLLVYDSASGAVKRFRIHPYATEWIGRDSLLLEYGRGTRILDLRNGKEAPSKYHGSLLSPDQSFSLSRGSDANEPRIWDELRGVDVTDVIERAIEGGQVRPIPAPFWVRDGLHGSLLCIPACRYSAGRGGADQPWANCATYLVDVSTQTVRRRIPGRAIAQSTDQRAVLMLHGRRLEFIDVSEP